MMTNFIRSPSEVSEIGTNCPISDTPNDFSGQNRDQLSDALTTVVPVLHCNLALWRSRS